MEHIEQKAAHLSFLKDMGILGKKDKSFSERAADFFSKKGITLFSSKGKSNTPRPWEKVSTSLAYEATTNTKSSETASKAGKNAFGLLKDSNVVPSSEQLEKQLTEKQRNNSLERVRHNLNQKLMIATFVVAAFPATAFGAGNTSPNSDKEEKGVSELVSTLKVQNNDRFDDFFDHMLKYEGGYSNHSSDKGGKTKYGITSRTLSAYKDKYKSDTTMAKKVIKLDKEQAKKIYRKMFYEKNNIHKIKNDTIAAQCFDMVVNHGPSTAGEMIQTQVNKILGTELETDGVMGSKTIDAINSANSKQAEKLNNALVKARKDKYKGIVDKDSTQKCFLEGWNKRAEAFACNQDKTVHFLAAMQQIQKKTRS